MSSRAQAERPREPISGEGEDFSRCRRPHFVGIGGAGQSGLARLLIARGLPVGGSDLHPSAVTRALAAEGAVVHEGHDAANLADADWVIVTDAAPDDNPEIVEARRRGLPVWRRSRLLGWLMGRSRGVAVTGTHGKSSTTALLGAMLEAAGSDPIVVVGAEVPAYGGNVRAGRGEWFVAEACEAYNAMLDLAPERAILTNLEADHLDHHKTLDGLAEAMRQFVRRLPADGLLVYGAENELCARIAADAPCRTVGFGLAAGDVRAEIIEETPEGTRFAVSRVGEMFTPQPGRHAALNALAAFAMAEACGCCIEAARAALAAFGGVARRLRHVGDAGGVALIDDYAHHPTEIRASLAALRQRYPRRRLVVAFQPHLYSRTRDFLEQFAEALTGCDALALTDIYPAREPPMPGISSGRVAERVGKLAPSLPLLYVPALEDVAGAVAPSLRPDDVFVAMGAGDINEVLEPIRARLMTDSRATRPVVTVLMGGSSAEREVSRTSGMQVAAALREKGYPVREFDPGTLRSRLAAATGGALGGEATARIPAPAEPGEVVFIALHGTFGEDGAIQGLLEIAGVPYTGSGVLASALAMDKCRCKRVLAAEGVPVLPGVLIGRADWEARLDEAPLPAVVKPNAQGSSVGLGFVETREALQDAVRVAFHYDHQVLIEPWIKGIELSACVLGNEDPVVLPLVEIVPEKGVYDYEAKYTPGATDEIVPARVPEELAEEAKRIAALSHMAIGCAGFSRVDMMAAEDGLFVLEVNTVPGLTPTSIFPRSAAAAGMSFADLCERLIELAREGHRARQATL